MHTFQVFHISGKQQIGTSVKLMTYTAFSLKDIQTSAASYFQTIGKDTPYEKITKNPISIVECAYLTNQ
jgi:hypothetical protein